MSGDDEALRRRLWYGDGIELPRITYTLGDDAAPVSDPSETLALIEQYRIRLCSTYRDGADVWGADVPMRDTYAEGPTIGEAVRACVARIKGER